MVRKIKVNKKARTNHPIFIYDRNLNRTSITYNGNGEVHKIRLGRSKGTLTYIKEDLSLRYNECYDKNGKVYRGTAFIDWTIKDASKLAEYVKSRPGDKERDNKNIMYRRDFENYIRTWTQDYIEDYISDISRSDLRREEREYFKEYLKYNVGNKLRKMGIEINDIKINTRKHVTDRDKNYMKNTIEKNIKPIKNYLNNVNKKMEDQYSVIKQIEKDNRKSETCSRARYNKLSGQNKKTEDDLENLKDTYKETHGAVLKNFEDIARLSDTVERNHSYLSSEIDELKYSFEDFKSNMLKKNESYEEMNNYNQISENKLIELFDMDSETEFRKEISEYASYLLQHHFNNHINDPKIYHPKFQEFIKGAIKVGIEKKSRDSESGRRPALDYVTKIDENEIWANIQKEELRKDGILIPA